MLRHYERYNKWGIKPKQYINKKVGQLAAKTQKADAGERYWRRHPFQSPINRSGPNITTYISIANKSPIRVR